MTPQYFGKDAVPYVHASEKVSVSGQHLCRTQEEKTAVLKAEVKARQGSSLGFNIEIDQDVAAYHQVNLRHGRILNQVVAAEDNRAA